MNSDVYIFGYQSILSAGSLATSIADSHGQLVPARLNGYIRGWSAVRTFVTNETKRYVHAKDWHIAKRVAFATLIQYPHKTVNGVCRRMPSDRLAALDFREQGYTRVEVSQNVDLSFPKILSRCFNFVRRENRASSRRDGRPSAFTLAAGL